nr:hypothetical protein [Rhizobium sp. NZLR8]
MMTSKVELFISKFETIRSAFDPICGNRRDDLCRSGHQKWQNFVTYLYVTLAKLSICSSFDIIVSSFEVFASKVESSAGCRENSRQGPARRVVRVQALTLLILHKGHDGLTPWAKNELHKDRSPARFRVPVSQGKLPEADLLGWLRYCPGLQEARWKSTGREGKPTCSQLWITLTTGGRVILIHVNLSA